MIYFRGHQWWIVSTCPPAAAVSGCMQSVSAALVIGDPVLQGLSSCPYCSSVILAAAVLVTLCVVLQCQWSRLLQYLYWCSIEWTSSEDCWSWLQAEPWHRNATEALDVVARKKRYWYYLYPDTAQRRLARLPGLNMSSSSESEGRQVDTSVSPHHRHPAVFANTGFLWEWFLFIALLIFGQPTVDSGQNTLDTNQWKILRYRIRYFIKIELIE